MFSPQFSTELSCSQKWLISVEKWCQYTSTAGDKHCKICPMDREHNYSLWGMQLPMKQREATVYHMLNVIFVLWA